MSYCHEAIAMENVPPSEPFISEAIPVSRNLKARLDGKTLLQGPG